MMMVLRMMRFEMMMAVLCFPLTLPPRSELLYLQSCLLKYIQLSSVDRWVLPRFGAPPLSHKIRASHCPVPQQSRIQVHIVFSCLNTGSAANPAHAPSKQYCTSSPYGSSDDTRAFFLSLIVLHGPYNVTYTSDLNNKNKWWQILVIPLPYLSLTPSLCLSASGATAKSCPLGSLRSGTVRPLPNVTLQWMHLFSAHVLSTLPTLSLGAGLWGRQSKEKKNKTMPWINQCE